MIDLLDILNHKLHLTLIAKKESTPPPPQTKNMWMFFLKNR